MRKRRDVRWIIIAVLAVILLINSILQGIRKANTEYEEHELYSGHNQIGTICKAKVTALYYLGEETVGTTTIGYYYMAALEDGSIGAIHMRSLQQPLYAEWIAAENGSDQEKAAAEMVGKVAEMPEFRINLVSYYSALQTWQENADIDEIRDESSLTNETLTNIRLLDIGEPQLTVKVIPSDIPVLPDGVSFLLILAMIATFLSILKGNPFQVEEQTRVEQKKQEEQKNEAALTKPNHIHVAGGWRCSCGRENAPYVSSCVCGLNKGAVYAEQKPKNPGREETQMKTKTTETAASTDMMKLSDLYLWLSVRANTDPIYGQSILPLIREYKTGCSSGADQEQLREVYSRMIKRLSETLLIVPCQPRDDVTDMKALRFSQRAADKFNEDSIVFRGNQIPPEQMMEMNWATVGDKPAVDMQWWDIRRIAGSEGYHFATAASVGEKMHPVKAPGANGSSLLCYTGIDKLVESVGEPTESKGFIGVFTLYDLAEMLENEPELGGIIINGNLDTHCFVDRDFWSN